MFYSMSSSSGVNVMSDATARIYTNQVRWRWVVSFMPLLLYPWGKSPWYPFDRRLGRPQSWSGWRGEEKILDPTRTRALTPCSQSLYWLRYPSSCAVLLMIFNDTWRIYDLLASNDATCIVHTAVTVQISYYPTDLFRCSIRYFSVL
jgi:hypothetical protein